MNEEEEDGPGRRGQRHIPTLPFMLPMLHASCLCLCPVFGHRMQSKIRTCQHNERAEETEAWRRTQKQMTNEAKSNRQAYASMSHAVLSYVLETLLFILPVLCWPWTSHCASLE
jgi:hypothetical protein